MLVFSTQLCELCPYNLLSGSTLSLFPVWISKPYTRIQCVRGEGCVVKDFRQISTCRKVPLQVNFWDDEILHCLLESYLLTLAPPPPAGIPSKDSNWRTALCLRLAIKLTTPPPHLIHISTHTTLSYASTTHSYASTTLSYASTTHSYASTTQSYVQPALSSHKHLR